ncbi:MAG TPA: hypothetical protein VEN30_27090 [Paraburkholderia sp.]|nr:hypothetical protein [Paraburkholderia sp.]
MNAIVTVDSGRWCSSDRRWKRSRKPESDGCCVEVESILMDIRRVPVTLPMYIGNRMINIYAFTQKKNALPSCLS